MRSYQEAEPRYVDPGQFIFGILFGTLFSTLLGIITQQTGEVTEMFSQEDEGGTDLMVYQGNPPLNPQTQIPVEIVGHTPNELAQSLIIMENSLNYGQKARVQLLTNVLPTQSDLDMLYSHMVATGFHTTMPDAKIIDGVPATEMVITKGSPIWSLLIPLIPTVIIGGLVAFGITRIETLTKALLPLMLVTIGGVVILAVVITRKPVLKTAQRYLERGGSLKSLPRTIPIAQESTGSQLKRPGSLAATVAKKVRAQSIRLDRAEGPTAVLGPPVRFDRDITPDIWKRANQQLLEWSRTAPKGGGYDKVDFTITYDDGETYNGRYDLKHWEDEYPNLASHVYDFVRFTAGKYHGALSQTEYDQFKKQEHMKKLMPSFQRFLEKYEINYLNAPTKIKDSGFNPAVQQAEKGWKDFFKGNRIQAMIDSTNYRIKARNVSDAKQKELHDSLKTDFKDLVDYQKLQSWGFASGLLTKDEASLLYRIFGGESPSPDKWDKLTLGEKVAATKLVDELLAVKLKKRGYSARTLPEISKDAPLLQTKAQKESGHYSGLTAEEKVIVDREIEAIPDVNDPHQINYWRDMGNKKIYLEGWGDICLTGQGFPDIGGGEWQNKIEFMMADSKKTLLRKEKENNLILQEGGFHEFPAGTRSSLYGATWGVYTKVPAVLKDINAQTQKESGLYGGWKPGDVAIYSDFGLRSLFIVQVLPKPGDIHVESVRAKIIDNSLYDWDMIFRRIDPWHELETEHNYHYTNLYRDINALIEKQTRILKPEILKKEVSDLKAHPSWKVLNRFGLTGPETLKLGGKMVEVPLRNKQNYITVTAPGKTTFNEGEVVSPEAFAEENKRVRELGQKEATGWTGAEGKWPHDGNGGGGNEMGLLPNIAEPERRARQENDIELLPDSPEYLAQTIDNSGWREKLDKEFQLAVSRTKG